MAEEKRAQYVVGLKDEMSPAAKSSAGALEALRNRIVAQQKALGEMQRAQRNVKGQSGQAAVAYKELSARIAAQKSVIAGAEASYINLGGTFGQTTKKAEGFFARLAKAPGPLGAAARSASEFASSLASPSGLAGLGVGALLALATAAAALTATVIAGTAALVRYGLAQADARRSELLHLEGLTTLRTAYQRQRETGGELQASIDRVADSSALARDELVPMAEGLYRAGLRGRDLTDTLDGLAIAQSVQGDRGAARFRAMAISAARTGGSVRAVADDIRSRLGPIASRQALSWDRQMSRLHESWSHLFDGVRIEGLLTILHEVVSSFSQSTASGRALRSIISALFGGVSVDATSAAAAVHHAFALMINGALRVTVAVLRVRNTLRDGFAAGGAAGAGEAFGNAIAKGISQTNWFGVGGRIVIGILRGLGSLVVVRDAIYGQVISFVAGLERAVFTQFVRVGSSMIDGVIGGVRRGVDRMRASVAGLGTQATSALTSALGIHSPSRVFAQLGVQIPRGVAAGVEAGAGTASDAVASMGSGLADDAPLGGGRATSTSSMSVGPFYLTLPQGTTRQQAESLRDELASILEGLTLRRGAQGA